MRLLETLKRRKRRFYKALLLALSVSLLTSLASYMGYLDGLEAKALDLLLWFAASKNRQRLFLFRSMIEAFRNLGESSRCRAPNLAGLFADDPFARGGAKAIGVDGEFKAPTDSFAKIKRS